MVEKGYSVRFVYADLTQSWPSISSDKGHSPHRDWGKRDRENLCLHKGKTMPCFSADGESRETFLRLFLNCLQLQLILCLRQSGPFWVEIFCWPSEQMNK